MVKVGIALAFMIFLCSELHSQPCCCKNEFDIKCDTTKIKDVGLLIRSCDNDSIYYYFIPCKSKEKFKITSYEMELGGYDYRLGAVVSKQTKTYVRFKYGCTATGGLCLYKDYNLRTGEVNQ